MMQFHMEGHNGQICYFRSSQENEISADLPPNDTVSFVRISRNNTYTWMKREELVIQNLGVVTEISI